MFRRNLGFDAAPGTAVARDDDSAFDIDSAALERVIILRYAVVDIHQLTGDITVDRVRVVGRQLLGFLARRRVFFERGFFQLRRELLRRCHLEQARFGRGEKNVEAFDLRVVSPGAKQARNEVRILFAVGRSQMVRPSRQPLHPVAGFLFFQEGIELFFQGALPVGALAREALKRPQLGSRSVLRRGTQDQK